MTATDVIPGDGSVPRVAVRGIALAILVHNLPVLVWARPILAVELALRTLRLPLAHPLFICERYRCESMDSCE